MFFSPKMFLIISLQSPVQSHTQDERENTVAGPLAQTTGEPRSLGLLLTTTTI